MKIVVLGASGKVGREVVKLQLAEGQEVIAFVHSRSPFEEHENLKIIKGDVHNPDDLDKALKNADSVICALGSWGTKQKDILSSATENILPIMKKYKISRFISVSGSDAEANGDKNSLIHKASRLGFNAFFGKILIDAEKHIKLLENSDLNWTVVRSPAMNNLGKINNYSLAESRPLPWQTVNRQSVAKALIDQLNSEQWLKKAPFISR